MNNDIALLKEQIRATMKAQRKLCTSDFCSQAGWGAAHLLQKERTFQVVLESPCVASYINIGNEFPTDEINLFFLSHQVSLCVPRYNVAPKGYTWAGLTLGAPMVRSEFGIPEPLTTDPFPSAEVGVAFVPGLKFDITGGRIGYGKGIYDRLLRRLRPSTIKIALCYDFQLQRDPLPLEEHDVSMDYIITESHWINCRTVRRVKRML